VAKSKMGILENIKSDLKEVN